jgi:hypothetical protein
MDPLLAHDVAGLEESLEHHNDPTPSSPAPMIFRLCSDKLSLEAIPKRKLTLDLTRFDHRPDVDVMVQTPYFLVIRFKDGSEVTLRKDGRMIIRRVRDERIAGRIAQRTLAIGTV